ncbi:MAG: YhjD/YihY/BrkB family envelope integrity protein [Polyangia bacterium]|jgi:membrane protein
MTAPSHEVAAMLSRRARAGLYLARLGLRIIKQWVRDRCPQQAAALTYQTTLGLVPLLALVFAALRQTHNLEARSRLVEFISTQVLPDMGDVVSELASFSEKVATGAAGGLGLGFTLATCYFLYDTVENTFNDIWHVTTRRSWFRKFLIFYPVVTLLPVLAGAYLYWSGRLIGSGPLARFFGPLSIQFGALFLVNWMLPNIRVRWYAALAGTLVTGFALEGLKWGFVHFAKGMLLSSYSGVYGPLALVPLILLWIYVSWWVVLGGAEIANAIQNLRLLEAEERRHRDDEPINGLVAAQVLAFVAADYQRGGKGVDRAFLSREFGLSVEVIDRVAVRLKGQGLLAEVQGDKEGFIPGRAADTISLQDVLAAFRSTDLEAAPGTTSPALVALTKDLEEARRARIGAITIAELMPK